MDGNKAKWAITICVLVIEIIIVATYAIATKPIAVAIKAEPLKTEYYVGEELDLTGLELFGFYENNITGIITSGYQADIKKLRRVGRTTVTVTYKDFPVSFDVSVTAPPGPNSEDEVLRHYLDGEWTGSSTTKIRFFPEELKIEYIEKTWNEPVIGSYHVENEKLVIQLKIEKPEGIRNYELVADCRNLEETGSFYLECFVDLPWHPETFTRTSGE